MIFFLVNGQVICGTAAEGSTVTLTAPPGSSFVSVEFASYGTPDGNCGSFTFGSCHATNSQAIVEAALIGQSTASIDANNGIFGDPCGGTVKRLYIQARYSTSLPLKLVSFTAIEDAGSVHLNWRSENEDNFRQFDIEKSSDGVVFKPLHSVAATSNGDYQFDDQVLAGPPAYYYRLKMEDQDGKFRYSAIVKIYMEELQPLLSAFPSPADHTVTVISKTSQVITAYDLAGRIMFNKKFIAGSQIIDISGWQNGVYVLKGEQGVVKIVKK